MLNNIGFLKKNVILPSLNGALLQEIIEILGV
jgi:hypothetical protein